MIIQKDSIYKKNVLQPQATTWMNSQTYVEEMNKYTEEHITCFHTFQIVTKLNRFF